MKIIGGVCACAWASHRLYRLIYYLVPLILCIAHQVQGLQPNEITVTKKIKTFCVHISVSWIVQLRPLSSQYDGNIAFWDVHQVSFFFSFIILHLIEKKVTIFVVSWKDSTLISSINFIVHPCFSEKCLLLESKQNLSEPDSQYTVAASIRQSVSPVLCVFVCVSVWKGRKTTLNLT